MNENEAITVTLTLENDEELECAVLSIFEAEEREKARSNVIVLTFI